jgi:hypothetical protein
MRSGSTRPMLRNNVDADEGFRASDELIDWTMQKVQDFTFDRNGQNARSHEVSVTLPELFDTIGGLFLLRRRQQTTRSTGHLWSNKRQRLCHQ